MHDPPRSWSRYLTPSIPLRDLGLYCLGAGWQEGHLRPMSDRTLDCYAAVLVHSGHGTFQSGARRGVTIVRPGTLFWLYPGVTHSYAPSRAGWSEYWLLFSGVAARSYETLGLLRRAEPVQSLTDIGGVRSLFERLIDVCHGGNPRQHAEAAMLIHQLIIDSARPLPDDPGVGAGDPLTEGLRANACTPMTLTEHARRLGLSVPALREHVRRESGSTPKELILQARLARAQALLASSQLPIQQVAREVGYDDPAYFSRIFRHRVGLSPRTFRDQRSLTSASVDSIDRSASDRR